MKRSSQLAQTTITVNQEIGDRYKDLYETISSGVREAANGFLWLRSVVLNEIKQIIDIEDFISINELVDDEILVQQTMPLHDVMLNAMWLKYNVAGGYTFSFQSLADKLRQLSTSHLYFLFAELRRFRVFHNRIPEFTLRHFWENEMF